MEAATAAQGDWLASRPVRRPRGSVCTRLACASLACSLEAPYAGPPAYFYMYSRALRILMFIYVILSR